MKLSKRRIVYLGYKLAVLGIMFNWSAYSQDLIVKSNGETIVSKIKEIGTHELKFKKFNNLEGPIYIVNISDIDQIRFENGSIETFTNQTSKKEVSIEELKENIIEKINKHGFEEDTFKRKCKASFEGDYLRIIVLRKNSDEESNGGILYDFSNVYKFQKVSKRSDKLAFINIWVSILKNKKKNKWDKHKLIMRVDGIPQAESILKVLKLYNKLLLSKNDEPISKY